MGKYIAAWLLAAAPAFAGNLVSVEWLQKNLSSPDVLVLDASSTKLYGTNHIPGAVSVDLYRYGAPYKIANAEMEKRIQSWGVDVSKRIVVYDEGGGQTAPWLFYQIYYHGFPQDKLFILDGGLAKWQAAGGEVTKDPTVAKPGAFQVTQLREDNRVRLEEFIAATGDVKKHAVIEALEPTYHFGGTQFFDRAGHIPNALMMPSEDFYNADKTFKSPEEIRKMAAHIGVRPEQDISTHCGGGVAATVPYFALKFVSGFPKVKVYQESQLEWLQDERTLPFWTYDAPALKRDGQWLSSWGSRMIRMYGVAQINVIDVRPAEAYTQGHVPYALNVPADVFKASLADPRKLAELLGPAGMNPGYEAVIVSSGGLNPTSALAFLMLEKLGHPKVSVLMDSIDDWAMRGFPVAKEPTVVGAPKSPKDFAVRPAAYAPTPRSGVVIADARATQGAYPKVFVASGAKVPGRSFDGKVVHVPYSDLVDAAGRPKAAGDIWNILAKAGVSRYAEVILYSEEPGEAAMNYFIMKLMGYPDVKVLVI
ncbi:MAG TPA: rhodanese-like domain-containing protein [Usitatibacter sp.]|nr:rhodanese-like domain-containing protein [Usitatibacter sp.]